MRLENILNGIRNAGSGIHKGITYGLLTLGAYFLFNYANITFAQDKVKYKIEFKEGETKKCTPNWVGTSSTKCSPEGKLTFTIGDKNNCDPNNLIKTREVSCTYIKPEAKEEKKDSEVKATSQRQVYCDDNGHFFFNTNCDFDYIDNNGCAKGDPDRSLPPDGDKCKKKYYASKKKVIKHSVRPIKPKECVPQWEETWISGLPQCNSNGKMTVTYEDKNKCNKDKLTKTEEKDCEYKLPKECTPKWEEESRKDCTAEGKQTVVYADKNNCDSNKLEKEETITCEYKKPTECKSDWAEKSRTECKEGKLTVRYEEKNKCDSNNLERTEQKECPTLTVTELKEEGSKLKLGIKPYLAYLKYNKYNGEPEWEFSGFNAGLEGLLAYKLADNVALGLLASVDGDIFLKNNKNKLDLRDAYSTNVSIRPGFVIGLYKGSHFTLDFGFDGRFRKYNIGNNVLDQKELGFVLNSSINGKIYGSLGVNGDVYLKTANLKQSAGGDLGWNTSVIASLGPNLALGNIVDIGVEGVFSKGYETGKEKSLYGFGIAPLVSFSGTKSSLFLKGLIPLNTANGLIRYGGAAGGAVSFGSWVFEPTVDIVCEKKKGTLEEENCYFGFSLGVYGESAKPADKFFKYKMIGPSR